MRISFYYAILYLTEGKKEKKKKGKQQQQLKRSFSNDLMD